MLHEQMHLYYKMKAMLFLISLALWMLLLECLDELLMLIIDLLQESQYFHLHEEYLLRCQQLCIVHLLIFLFLPHESYLKIYHIHILSQNCIALQVPLLHIHLLFRGQPQFQRVILLLLEYEIILPHELSLSH